MRKIILLIPFLFVISTINAQQYTLTDADGNEVTEGSTITHDIPDLTGDHGVEFHLHSTTSDNFVLNKISTDQPSGSITYFCVGINCFSPGATTTGPVAVDESNEALISLHYRPLGNEGETTVCYTIHKEGDENVSFDLCVTYVPPADNTGISSLNEANELSAYPNPANDRVSVSYSAKEDSKLVIFNIVGEKVIERNIAAGDNKVEIETSSLSSGTYFYSIVSDARSTKTKRLVIKH